MEFNIKEPKFKISYYISKYEFNKLKELDEKKLEKLYIKIQKTIYNSIEDKVDYLHKRFWKFVSKWLEDYKIKKDLVDNYTYEHIEIIFTETFEESLVRYYTPKLKAHLKNEGLI